MGKRLIEDLVREAEEINTRDGPAFVTSQEHKKDREAWVLGNFTKLYNGWSYAKSQLIYAEDGDSDFVPADFAIFSSDGSWICDIEIAEVLDQGRRRDEEYRNRSLGQIKHIPEVPDPYASVEDILKNKFTKALSRYRKPTWLLLYVNVSSSIYELLDSDYFGAARAVIRALKAVSFDKTSIVELWILKSKGNEAIRAFPKVIVLPYLPYLHTPAI